VALELRRISFESNQRCAINRRPISVSLWVRWNARFCTAALIWVLNACVECCDRWIGDGRVGLEWIGRDGSRETLTSAALQQTAIRFANMLARAV